jgi:hypothetical protein
MNHKRFRFRFGLHGLFALIAAVAVLASLWNPLIQPRTRSNLQRVRRGMTQAEVVKLVGDPDTVNVFRGVMSTRYQLTAEETWIVSYIEERVHVAFRQMAAANEPSPRAPSLQSLSAPTMLNPAVIVRKQD